MMILKMFEVLAEHEINDIDHQVLDLDEKEAQFHQNLGHPAKLLK